MKRLLYLVLLAVFILPLFISIGNTQTQTRQYLQVPYTRYKQSSGTPSGLVATTGYNGLYATSTGFSFLKPDGTTGVLATSGSSALSANRFVYAGTSGVLTAASAATNGQILIGSTGAAPALAALTAGTGMTVTNGAGTITLTPNFAAPPAIGSTTPGAITGTTITANTSLTINGGTAITKVISATASLDFDLSSSASQDLTITVTGAALGDTVSIGIPNGSVTTDTLFMGWVSASDTVTIRALRISGTPDPPAGTFRASVTQF